MCAMADEENVRRHASSKMITPSTSTVQTARGAKGSGRPVRVCNDTVKEHSSSVTVDEEAEMLK
jgi:hypothetical protein